MSPPDLGALVSARLCHDLISPMGAIGNGLELMGMAERAPSAELTLINESLATALAKLRYYRIAFGPVDAQASQSFDEARAITDAMFQGRFTVNWAEGTRNMSRATARLVYLALLCIEKSLPMGGVARVSLTGEGAALVVDGRRTAPPATLWAHVSDGTPVPDLRSDAVQFAFLRQALVDTGRSIAFAFSDAGAQLTIPASCPSPATTPA